MTVHAPYTKTESHPDEIIGSIDPGVIDMGSYILNLAQNRLYMSAFYVPETCFITGGVTAQTAASVDKSSILRAGVHKFVQPTGNEWRLGPSLVDFGTMSAAESGHRVFRAAERVEMEAGWYLSVLGTTGEGVSIRCHKWASPGFAQYTLTGSGVETDFASKGAAVFLFARGLKDKILNGFEADWSDVPLLEARSNLPFVNQLVVPSWTR